MFDFHLWPFKQATVASMSSMSPWRQLCPSILEIDAMFPAPKASAWVGSSTRIAIATSSKYCEEFPMMMYRVRIRQYGDVKESKSWSSKPESFARRRSQLYVTGKAAVQIAPHVIGPLSLAEPSNLRVCNPVPDLSILLHPEMLRGSFFFQPSRFAKPCKTAGHFDCATLPHFMC